jgi:type IV pilus assembly protein PilY1
MYVGDTGGSVWRVDVSGSTRSSWTIVKLANLGRHYNNSPANDRRFFHRPDFVKFKDGSGAYDAVIIGSGNRANPLNTTVEDWFYMIKDRDITPGKTATELTNHSVLSHTDFGDVTTNCLQDSSCGGSPPSLGDGWRLQLEQDGEKNLATPTTLAKQIYFTTYTPADATAIANNTSCAPSEGTGRLYAVSLADATAVNDYNVGNGITKDKTDRHTDLDSGGIPAEVVYIPFNKVLKPDLSIEEVNTASRWKTYWYPIED